MPVFHAELRPREYTSDHELPMVALCDARAAMDSAHIPAEVTFEQGEIRIRVADFEISLEHMQNLRENLSSQAATTKKRRKSRHIRSEMEMFRGSVDHSLLVVSLLVISPFPSNY